MTGIPDGFFTLLFYLAMFGLACGVIIAVIGSGWAGYHLFMALSAYLGG